MLLLPVPTGQNYMERESEREMQGERVRENAFYGAPSFFFAFDSYLHFPFILIPFSFLLNSFLFLSSTPSPFSFPPIPLLLLPSVPIPFLCL